MAELSDEEVRMALGAAFTRAGYPPDDPDAADAVDLFQWHHCVGVPACTGHDGGPCACAGSPYLSDAIWAHVGPVINLLRARPQVWWCATCRDIADPCRVSPTGDGVGIHVDCRSTAHRWREAEAMLAGAKDRLKAPSRPDNPEELRAMLADLNAAVDDARGADD